MLIYRTVWLVGISLMSWTLQAQETGQNNASGRAQKTGQAQTGQAQAGAQVEGRAGAGRAEAQGEAGRAEAGRAEAGRTEAGRTEAGRTDAQPGRTDRREGRARRANVAGDEATSTTIVGATGGRLENYIVHCLKWENKNEVEVSKLAAQQASHADVKAFAQQMVKDHTDLLAKLERLEESGLNTPAATVTRTRTGAAAGSEATPRAESRERSRTEAGTPEGAARRDDNTEQRETADRDSSQERRKGTGERTQPEGARDRGQVRSDAGVEGRVDVNREETTAYATVRPAGGEVVQKMMQIKQEIAERNLATAQRELNSKQGQEFDKCYIGMQIAAHSHMADGLTVLNQHTSGELQQVIDGALQTTQQHLEHAKRLMEKLEGSAGSNEGRTEQPGTRPARPGRNPTESAK